MSLSTPAGSLWYTEIGGKFSCTASIGPEIILRYLRYFPEKLKTGFYAPPNPLTTPMTVRRSILFLI